MNILEQVYRVIEKYHMIKAGEKIIVGVSGGPDSVVLTDILYRLKQQLKISLHVAHLNHMFRGEESQEDANFVKRLANAYDLPVTIRNYDVPAFKNSYGLSSQVAARLVRYEFFEETAGREEASKVALAHHADDQAETVLLHFLRGAGLTGLRGMLPVRDNFYIRPLLYIRREDIENYCRDRNLSYRLDSSNFKSYYLRNKIRMHLIPTLEKEYNQGLVPTLSRLAEICRDEENYLEVQAEIAYHKIKTNGGAGKLGLRLKEFCLEPKAIQRRILRLVWNDLTGDYKDLAYGHVDKTLEFIRNNETGGMLELPKGVHVKKNYETLTVVVNKHKSEEVESFFYQVKVPGSTYIPEIKKTLYCDILLMKNFNQNLSQLCENEAYIDYDQVTFPIFVRSRQPGDTFQPFGLKGTMKLKKFFINQKLPWEKRNRIPLVESGGKIIWVGGMRIAENVKINKGTQKIMHLKLK